MTVRSRLLQAIDNAPEPVLQKVLDFLNFLSARYNQAEYQPAEYQPLDTEKDEGISITELSGLLYDPTQKTVSLDEMENAIAQGAANSL